ncbi:hemoglobin, beta adult 2 [Pimephales promelas]|uniref:hemoglobin cathodic subunit beta-like n=1 Tax=Pimephales promelas TaxID=90988 RepID=UPI001955B225|nr:hemoglobin cathodic subunit beta-like [Pimephales promelas]XP_039541958.1 hemoglobin, beta adult 2 [Pimephales promelas]KAG1968892.1 hemoglobin subunit alpha [Pimephales promelas]
MVEWSDSERKTVASLWGKINIGEIGPQSLARVLIVYPWTQRYFGAFGDLSNAAAILGNPKVSAHGKTVLTALDKAVKNMDNIKAVYAPLSQLHCEKLNVDPGNFTLLADCLTIILATTFGPAFTPAVQATWQKLLTLVVTALTSQYF